MTAYVVTFLLFIAKGDPIAVTKALPDRLTCEQMMGTLADKAQADVAIVGWVFVGDPCRPIKEANKI